MVTPLVVLISLLVGRPIIDYFYTEFTISDHICRAAFVFWNINIAFKVPGYLSRPTSTTISYQSPSSPQRSAAAPHQELYDGVRAEARPLRYKSAVEALPHAACCDIFQARWP